MTTILDSIDGHDDLLRIPQDQLPQLAEEIRDRICEVMPINGGHFGSGLGITDLTIALHRVFDFRKDHFVLDVSHQCYPHKLLTGRRDAYRSIRQKGGPAGYTRPAESDYDRFMWAHAGTAISTALGLARAHKDDSCWAVAIVGDASISSGVSLEALNHWADEEGLRLLVILNDNGMSIAPNVGGLSRYFQSIKDEHQSRGSFADGAGQDRHLGRFFEAFGHRYVGPVDGHDLDAMIDLFTNIKNAGNATFMHVSTVKGKGHREAEKDQWKWHAVGGAKAKGPVKAEHSRLGKVPFTDVFVEAVIERARRDDDLHAITAAMPCGTGLKKFAPEFPDRFHDTGIAEQHAVAFAAGLAKGGKKVACAIYSTFLQRAYDMLFQEISLNRNPVVLCMDRAGIVGPDGATHNGCFDIAYLRSVPHINIMAPADGSELKAMLEMSFDSGLPCALRYPRTAVAASDQELPVATPLAMGKATVLRRGHHAAILAYGSMVYPAYDAAELLEAQGIDVTVINARFVRPLDREMLREAIETHPAVFTVEEHTVNGGFGSACLEEAARSRWDAARLYPIGLPDEFVEHGTRAEMLEEHGLLPEGIARQIHEVLTMKRNDAAIRSAREAEAY
ncbi:MAG: 1-deoxy-D-xylulose-5-phosphate synthase [Planctomycetes bacterium]|nr:1-deoxy-D-xylulose-5-phosphate synthase [Planctomycetota bacterium]